MVRAHSSSRALIQGLLLLAGCRHAYSWKKGKTGERASNGFDFILVNGNVNNAPHSASDGIIVIANEVDNDDKSRLPDKKKPDITLGRKLETTSSWIRRDGATLVGTSDFDKFGASSSLSADGLVLAVGAPYSNGGGVGDDTGSVQVYEYINGTSYQPRGPAINGTALGNTFGWAVSLSNDGEILAVGTPNSSGDDGYVKIYKYDGSKYNEVIYLSVSYTELFGYSISLSGDGKTLAVSDPQSIFGGTVYLYGIDAEAGTTSASPTEFWGYGMGWSDLGYSVSVSDDGNVLAAAIPYKSEVQIHQFDGTSYQLACTMIGEVVTLSGDGTRFAVRKQTSATVSVYAINAARAECIQLGQAIPITTSPPPASDNYDGTTVMSLSNDGHVLAVVNPLNTTGVQVYEETYNAAGQLEYVSRGDAIVIANSTSVSLSDDGRVLAIGVPFRDLGNGQFEDNGSTLVYEWPSQAISIIPTQSPTPVSLHCRIKTVCDYFHD
jgi:hypothetical protein